MIKKRGETMLFIISRFIFWSLAFIVCLLLIKKLHIIHKRKWFLAAFAAAVIFMIVSALIPIENAFITFSSPQSAYNYNHSGNVKLVVEGKKQTLSLVQKTIHMFMQLFPNWREAGN